MSERYFSLSSESSVFRTVQTGGGFLPAGHLFPKPEWLEPNERDQQDADRTGRVAGLSVWDRAKATVVQACVWRQLEPEQQVAFAASVGSLREAARAYERDLDVVSDPLPVDEEPWAGILAAHPDGMRSSQRFSADGHTLVEGIKRPADVERRRHRDFREALSREFTPC